MGVMTKTCPGFYRAADAAVMRAFALSERSRRPHQRSMTAPAGRLFPCTASAINTVDGRVGAVRGDQAHRATREMSMDPRAHPETEPVRGLLVRASRSGPPGPQGHHSPPHLRRFADR